MNLTKDQVLRTLDLLNAIIDQAKFIRNNLIDNENAMRLESKEFDHLTNLTKNLTNGLQK